MKTTEEVNTVVQKFAAKITNGKLQGAETIAMETVNLLEKIISEIEHDNAAQLLSTIRGVGRHLVEAVPQQNVCSNMVRRVLRIIRDEYHALNESAAQGGTDGPTGASLQQLVRAAAARRSVHLESLLVRAPVLDHIAEFKTELETSSENIAAQASEHIHASELILIFGADPLLERFLRRAARDRTFHLIVVPCGNHEQSTKMAANLEKAKIEVTVIEDCAVMAVMSRVNKVIMSTESVLASGGLRADAGSLIVALAAKHYSVPVIVVSGLYQLCPVHWRSDEQDEFDQLLSPESALPYGQAPRDSCDPSDDLELDRFTASVRCMQRAGNSQKNRMGALVNQVHAYVPMYDYVPPDLVTLFVTNLGGNSPSYIYRMMSELYDPGDYEL